MRNLEKRLRALDHSINTGENYTHNIRCGKCNKLHSTHNIIPARHYNSFDSYCCGGCGATKEFVDCYEFWVSECIWYKPWTWLKGEWKEVK